MGRKTNTPCYDADQRYNLTIVVVREHAKGIRSDDDESDGPGDVDLGVVLDDEAKEEKQRHIAEDDDCDLRPLVYH